MRGVAAGGIAITLLVAACGSGARPTGVGRTLVERVRTTPSRSAASGCAFLIRAPLVGGGRQVACITRLDGVPGAGTRMRSRGWMTFRLQKGSIRALVRVTQRFGPDGVHARQTVRGSIVSGTRAYRRVRGTFSGQGTVVDRAGGLGPVDIRYTLHLTGG